MYESFSPIVMIDAFEPEDEDKLQEAMIALWLGRREVQLPAIPTQTATERALDDVYVLLSELEYIQFAQEVQRGTAAYLEALDTYTLDVNTDGDIVDTRSGEVVSEWVWAVDDVPGH